MNRWLRWIILKLYFIIIDIWINGNKPLFKFMIRIHVKSSANLIRLMHLNKRVHLFNSLSVQSSALHSRIALIEKRLYIIVRIKEKRAYRIELVLIGLSCIYKSDIFYHFLWTSAWTRFQSSRGEPCRLSKITRWTLKVVKDRTPSLACRGARFICSTWRNGVSQENERKPRLQRKWRRESWQGCGAWPLKLWIYVKIRYAQFDWTFWLLQCT